LVGSKRWRLLGIVLFLLLLILARGLWNATRDPIIHRATVAVANWPAEQPPLTILLISDVHVAGPDMSPERLDRLVGDYNRLKPDLVLIAGDLISGKRWSNRHYSPAEIAAPLAHFRAPLGVVAVLGNHDYWHDAAAQARELRQRGITVLTNQAVERGPIVIGGIADEVSEHDDVPATWAAMDALPPRPRVLLTHGPDVVPDLPDRTIAAVFSGHTHCGQIVLPLVGALSYSSRYGDRFACGRIDYEGLPVFVGAGMGTSIVPLRFGAPPSVWLVTLGPVAATEPVQ
jgi:hypothetical protein